MNWYSFKTHGESPEHAFEVLCNQLFDNWCHAEYKDEYLEFKAVNGSGGDGGVESFCTLKSGKIVALQAKWFLNSIGDGQIRQIKNSILTAMAVRPNIERYIVCVPRDLSSKTNKSESNEDTRWSNLLESIKKEYPDVTIELWNDTRITTECQKAASAGIERFWFENSEISDEQLTLVFEKAKAGWLKTKYIPDLTVTGRINDCLDEYLGTNENAEYLYDNFIKLQKLCKQFLTASDDLLEVYKDCTEELKSIIEETRSDIQTLCPEIETLIKWLKCESIVIPQIKQSAFRYDYEVSIHLWQIDRFANKYYNHFAKVTGILSEISKLNIRSLILKAAKRMRKRGLLFLGDPGTGKTTGVSSYSEKLMGEKFHLPILIRAKGVSAKAGWREIIISALAISNQWNEDEIWQGLTATVRRNSFNERYINREITILPKVLIIVDGIDEADSFEIEAWKERMAETNVITEKYPYIRFCFTSRPVVFTETISNMYVVRLSGGDVSVKVIFDKYLEHYGIRASNIGWLKRAINTPLALRLFCELNNAGRVDLSDSDAVSIGNLWRKKIEQIESELLSRFGLHKDGQYVIKAINVLAELFTDVKDIKQDELYDKLRPIISNASNKLSTNDLVNHLVDNGVLISYCIPGTGISADEYIYKQGIQGYFDYASAVFLLDRYGEPQKIDFKENSHVNLNTFYALAVLAMQKYQYLITDNETIGNDTYGCYEEISYYALLHSSAEAAKNFKTRLLKHMSQNAQAVELVTNRLILPLSSAKNHPLGSSLLDEFLNGFETPAARDIMWSLPANLGRTVDSKYFKTEDIELSDYELSDKDIFYGIPTVYAWRLSSVDNSERLKARCELMKWAIHCPDEFYKLFEKFSCVNDPQIKVDIFSILMCLVCELSNDKLTSTAANFVMENILDPHCIDDNRNIAIRYYSIAIVEKAISSGIVGRKKVKKYLPPYRINNQRIDLNGDALSGTRMSGYKAIDYDLARYGLVDHFMYVFPDSNVQKEQMNILLREISDSHPEFCEMESDNFFISAAYAFILKMGWNEDDFYRSSDRCEKNKDRGADAAILEVFQHSEYGARSVVMRVCEKYFWQARNELSGFLFDRVRVTVPDRRRRYLPDYGLIDNFEMPLQEMIQKSPLNMRYERPLYLPEKVDIDSDCKISSIDTLTSIAHKMPVPDWEKWVFISNDGRYEIEAEGVLVLSSHYVLESESGVDTYIDINSLIMNCDDVSRLVKRLKIDTELADRVSNPNEWCGGIETASCISPKEVCWFTWKKQHGGSAADEIKNINTVPSVIECHYNFLEHGTVYYYVPSAEIRELLEIVDTDGYEFFDSEKSIKAEHRILGDPMGTEQRYIVVPRDELLGKMSGKGRSIVWFARRHLMESRFAKEKLGEKALIDIDESFIGYLDGENIRFYKIYPS